jgi:hypothetical protein
MPSTGPGSAFAVVLCLRGSYQGPMHRQAIARHGIKRIDQRLAVHIGMERSEHGHDLQRYSPGERRSRVADMLHGDGLHPFSDFTL